MEFFPITTPENSRAIGLSLYPANESSEALANFILGESQKISYSQLPSIVAQKHGLASLVEKLDAYIKPGV